MFDRATLTDTHSAISLQVLASGPMPFGSQAGQMIDLFGQVPVRANLSARQAKALGLMTSGTSGPPSTTSSESDALQKFLESRLQAKTLTLGSTLYALTWKPWVTASGRSRFRLRASVRRTSGTASTGQHALEIDGVGVPLELLKAWPTQAARDFRTANLKTFQERGGGKKGEQLNNAEVHLLSGWPTPQTSDSTGGGAGEASDGRYASRVQSERLCDAGGLDNAERLGFDQGRNGHNGKHDGKLPSTAVHGGERTGPLNGMWAGADWLLCRDGKWRPVEPGTFPLANGAPARVGRLRAYGNAINAEAARVFIEAVMECAP